MHTADEKSVNVEFTKGQKDAECSGSCKPAVGVPVTTQQPVDAAGSQPRPAHTTGNPVRELRRTYWQYWRERRAAFWETRAAYWEARREAGPTTLVGALRTQLGCTWAALRGVHPRNADK